MAEVLLQAQYKQAQAAATEAQAEAAASWLPFINSPIPATPVTKENQYGFLTMAEGMTPERMEAYRKELGWPT